MPPRRSNEDISTLGHLNLIENSRESARWGVTGAVEESDGIMLFASGSSLPTHWPSGASSSSEAASAT